MPPDRKEAAERLRQLVNSNFENEIAVSVNYDICLSKTDTSLLTVNKYPDKYVARLFEGTAPTNIIITRNTVEEIREDITRRFPAMLPFARNKEDHKSVVESWI